MKSSSDCQMCYFLLFLRYQQTYERRQLMLKPCYLLLDLYLEFDDSGQISTKFMINGTTSILKSSIFQICAAIYQLLLHMVFTSHNLFAMQGPVAIILISWNVIFIWETGYWTRAMKRFALFDLLKSLYSDTKILSKYIPSLQKRL